MELSPGAFCSICFESFTASHLIYFIACGHVFHGQCIERWMLRSINCPECRRPFNFIQKLFLNFEDDSKIQSYVGELKKLRDKLHESEKKLFNMQKQYIVCQNQFVNMQKQYIVCQNQFVNMQKQCTVSENKVRELEKEMDNVRRYAEALRRQNGSKQTEDYGASNSSMNVMFDNCFERELAGIPFWYGNVMFDNCFERELAGVHEADYYAEDPFLVRDLELQLQPYGSWREY
uniref:RING-type domain-containing protein n=1 Tax=Glossina palpalis gambiensis TaxID=67801 RepID=A0A1B0BS79_9MUSC